MSEQDVWEALSHWSPLQLRALKAQLDERFPTQSLNDFNIETELLSRYTDTTDLWESIAMDDKVPANQKAQVMNACTSLLEKIAKLQNETYDSERLKRLEKAFIETLTLLPNKEKALELYEQVARKLVH